jgi:hypothetical protein
MPQLNRGTRALPLVATALCAIFMPGLLTAEVEDERRAVRQASKLRGIIGHWTERNDNGTVFRTDGAVWNGQTTATQASAVSKELFGAASDSFVANVTAPGAFPLAVAPGADFSNGTLKVQFRLVSGQTDQTAGIVFGLGSNGEYHYLRYNTKDGNLAVWRYLKGERQVVKHGTEHAELKLGEWQELVVTIAGPVVRGALVGRPAVVVEHAFDAPVTGRVGVWTKRDSVTDFRNFTATAAR